MGVGIEDLATVNAALNASAAVFLVAGYLFIRNGWRHAHERCWKGHPALFLVSYVVYHLNMGRSPSKAWARFGWSTLPF
jgi:uncharacterized membrane protein YozB (DUF420 family)